MAGSQSAAPAHRNDAVARWTLLASCALALATVSAKGEIYRCRAEDGSVRFADRPEACEGARPHVPGPALQQVVPEAAPPARPSQGGPADRLAGWGDLTERVG